MHGASYNKRVAPKRSELSAYARTPGDEVVPMDSACKKNMSALEAKTPVHVAKTGVSENRLPDIC